MANVLIARVSSTEEQWNNVVSCSGLPPDARTVIGDAIATYRVMERARCQAGAAETDTLLADLSNHALKLDDLMTASLTNPLASVVLTRALNINVFERSRGDQGSQRKLENAIIENEKLVRWFSTARTQIVKGSPGARRRAMSINWLIFVLDKILQQFTKRQIDRSRKGRRTLRDYITAVCAVADPTISAFSIEGAMERLIRSRGRNRSRSGL